MLCAGQNPVVQWSLLKSNGCLFVFFCLVAVFILSKVPATVICWTGRDKPKIMVNLSSKEKVKAHPACQMKAAHA